MAEIVNLNRFRKSRTKDEEKSRAGENRTRHGRTKAEKANDRQAAARREKDLRGKELEPKDE